MRLSIIILMAMIFLAATCNKENVSKLDRGFFKNDFKVQYIFNKPDAIFDLPRSLTEISGLTYSSKLDMLYAINDEKGYIYGVSHQTGEIVDRIDFGKPDDYEGIAYHENFIYVVESNGNIKVVNEEFSERHVEFDDKLSRHNDIEGLVYNAQSDNLLLAAKGRSKVDGNDKDYKSLFTMNIEDGVISEEPFLKINVKEVLENFKTDQFYGSDLAGITVTARAREFAPSGIAIHPTQNDLYILSARGKLLMICSLSGEIKALVFLEQAMHLQPEGICFAPDGTLFISNEGKGRNGKIFKYNATNKM